MLRRRVSGDAVRYVVNRNIKYTNVCSFRCTFCAFSKGRNVEHLRGRAYDVELHEVSRRVTEAWRRGASEICMQGGIHPRHTGQTYLDLLAAAKAGAPSVHVHAFSPLEVSQGARTLGISVEHFLRMLKDAGLGSFPGTAAEILDDAARAILCPDKLSTDEWVSVVSAAHRAGLPTTSTIMFGRVDMPLQWARHLLALRDLQEETGGITEFVPLPFVPMAPLYFKGRARKGPTFRETLLMHAVARLVLHPLITNIQTSWVKLGQKGVVAALSCGANDLGGTLMNESISRAAGTQHGQELPPPEAMDALILKAGRTPAQRTTLYGQAAPDRVGSSYGAPELQQPISGEIAGRNGRQRAQV